MQPVAAEAAEQSEAGDENYLFDDLIAQIAHHPRQWQLIVTIGQAGDPTNDATQAWPEGRQQVNAGTVTIDRASSEDAGRCTAVNYDPLVLPAGIEPSDLAGVGTLPLLATGPWKRLRSAIRQLPDHATDPELHRIRILAKRARYAAEAVAPVAGVAAAAFAKAAAAS